MNSDQFVQRVALPTFPLGAIVLGFAEREVLLLLTKGVGDEPAKGVGFGVGVGVGEFFCTVI